MMVVGGNHHLVVFNQSDQVGRHQMLHSDFSSKAKLLRGP